jgi:hypothetical protein
VFIDFGVRVTHENVKCEMKSRDKELIRRIDGGSNSGGDNDGSSGSSDSVGIVYSTSAETVVTL